MSASSASQRWTSKGGLAVVLAATASLLALEPWQWWMPTAAGGVPGAAPDDRYAQSAFHAELAAPEGEATAMDRLTRTSGLRRMAGTATLAAQPVSMRGTGHPSGPARIGALPALQVNGSIDSSSRPTAIVPMDESAAAGGKGRAGQPSPASPGQPGGAGPLSVGTGMPDLLGARASGPAQADYCLPLNMPADHQQAQQAEQPAGLCPPFALMQAACNATRQYLASGR